MVTTIRNTAYSAECRPREQREIDVDRRDDAPDRLRTLWDAMQPGWKWVFVGLRVAKAAIVVLGLPVALQGYRAARRERSQRMLLLAGGSTVLSLAVLEGICYDVFQLSTLISEAIQREFVGLGMVLVVASLFASGTTVQEGLRIRPKRSPTDGLT